VPRSEWGQFSVRQGDELSVIAVAALGGTSPVRRLGTMIGTLMIGLIHNG
jgi:ribose/xylose/arabinose/galactoside ABC-type transport system permease subunit